MAQNQETVTVNGVSFKMVKVEGGSFKMGATPEQEMDNDLVMPECLADRESQNGKKITNATGIRLVMEYR